jgi:large subunit ribosomal protein L30
MSPATKSSSKKKMIQIKQVRSGIGCPRYMRETLRALGLGKMHRVTSRVDSPETRGMIARIPHLVQVVES